MIVYFFNHTIHLSVDTILSLCHNKSEARSKACPRLVQHLNSSSWCTRSELLNPSASRSTQSSAHGQEGKRTVAASLRGPGLVYQPDAASRRGNSLQSQFKTTTQSDSQQRLTFHLILRQVNRGPVGEDIWNSAKSLVHEPGGHSTHWHFCEGKPTTVSRSSYSLALRSF